MRVAGIHLGVGASNPNSLYDLYFGFNGNLTNTGTLTGVTATPTETPTYTAGGVELSFEQIITIDATTLELGTSQWQFKSEINLSIIPAASNVFSKNDEWRTDGFEIGVDSAGAVFFYKYGADGAVFITTESGAITISTNHVLEVYFDGTNVKIDVDSVNKLTSPQVGLNVVSIGNPYRVGGISAAVNPFQGTQKNLSFNVGAPI